MDTEEKTIIYIALSNQIMNCNEMLKEDNLSIEDKELIEYISESSLNIIDKYMTDITESPISKPQW